jgi:hypothetical protein
LHAPPPNFQDGLGIKIYIDDINLIRYKKPWNHKIATRGFIEGGCFGFGVIAIPGLLINGMNNRNNRGIILVSLVSGLALGLLGYILGSVDEVLSKAEETIRIKDESPDQIEKILKQLKKLAQE